MKNPKIVVTDNRAIWKLKSNSIGRFKMFRQLKSLNYSAFCMNKALSKFS